ncbi:site-specific DNA-methyltransferase, partial [candidate division WWE3 bacterium CG_4_10_14_0_2_um_filter_41_14]
MPKNRKLKKDISLGQYQHNKVKRVNNPQVGLVSSDLDTKPKKKVYRHDPYIDPTLSWAGKAEGTSFDVDTVSLHIHERIDPKRIIKQVLKKTTETGPIQPSLFEQPSENLNTEKEFDFYHHTKNWSNRLIAGDSLLVMNSLLEKENMAGKVQMIYMDPPYGITYNSNFQPYTNKRDVKDKDDDSIPAEPEMIKAFRDTWELGVHSYLTHLRDRLKVARELISESGSCFVQISDENLHYVRCLMDEVFGSSNFVSVIAFQTKIPLGSNNLANLYDYVVWYAKNKSSMKYRQLYKKRDIDPKSYGYIELNNGNIRRFKPEDDMPLIKKGEARIFRILDLVSSGRTETCIYDFKFNNEIIKRHSSGRSWKTTKEGMDMLIKRNRLVKIGNAFGYKLYYDDYPVMELYNNWSDTVNSFLQRRYVVETNPLTIQRCILMTTDPGDIVVDPTCGSGTSSYVAEQWGRRWITCDTSRVAIQLAKQRLMTAGFNYFQLAQSDEGVSSGFKYKTVPHVTLGSIANNEPSK